MPGVGGIAEGTSAFAPGTMANKFRKGGLMIVRAGGGAGMFSGIIGGWLRKWRKGIRPSNKGDQALTTILDPTAERSVAARPGWRDLRASKALRSVCSTSPRPKATSFLDRPRATRWSSAVMEGQALRQTNQYTAQRRRHLSQQIATEVDVVIEALSD